MSDPERWAKMKRLLNIVLGRKDRQKFSPGNSFRRDQYVALASKLCVGPNRKPVMNMKREDIREPDKTDLTGWIMFSGAEDSEFMSDPANFVRVSLPSYIKEDPSMGFVVDLPVGAEVVRNQKEMRWRRVIDNKVYDSDATVLAELDPETEE